MTTSCVDLFRDDNVSVWRSIYFAIIYISSHPPPLLHQGNSLNVYNASCLFSACEAGHTGIVQFLVDHKNFPQHMVVAQTKYGTSVLHAAAEKGQGDLI
jgi:hypothetical protein